MYKRQENIREGVIYITRDFTANESWPYTEILHIYSVCMCVCVRARVCVWL